MLEHNILKAFLDPDTYTKYRSTTEFSVEVEPWVKTIDEWFSTRNTPLTVDDLHQLHLARHPVATKGQRDLMNEFITRLKEVDTSTPVIEEVLRLKKQQEQYMDWAEKFSMLGTQKASVEDFLSLKTEIEEFDATKADSEFPALSISADDMLEASLKQGRWSLNLPVFQDKIGGIGSGVFALIAARPNCYSDDTEVLTENGWKLFKDLAPEEKVASVSHFETKFVVPSQHHAYEVEECLLHMYNAKGTYDMLVTKDHNIISVKSSKYSWDYEAPIAAKDFKPSSLRYFDLSGRLPNPYHGLARPEEWQLTPMQRFLIAYQADGSKERKGCTGARGHVTVRFSFTKERKKKRLRGILKDTGLVWKEVKENAKPNYSIFYVQVPTSPPKTFDWVDLASIPSATWAENFIEELSYWDATRRSDNRFKYDTQHKINADVVQAVACLAGYRAIYKQTPPYKTHHSFNNTVHILKNNLQSTRSILIEEVPYKGKVYCVTVPSGAVVVRRNGKPIVSGNCGKSLTSIHLCFGPKGWAEQGAKIVYLGNEEAIHRTKHRAICSWAGMGYKHSKMNPSEFKEKVAEFDEKFKDKVVFLHKSGMMYYDIEKLLDEHHPDILIIDQLDKLHVKGDAPAHEKMRIVYTTMREYSVNYECAIIGVCQASEAAAGKKFFGFDALEHSKTGKAAELDLCICIGKEDLQEDNNMRYFYLAKNKLTGDESSGSFMINKELSRMEV